MWAMPDRSRSYVTGIEQASKGRGRVPVLFDPNDAWGSKREHHITGTVAGMGIRGTVVHDGAGWNFTLGPAWLRDCPVRFGVDVEVVVAPEGPQRADLAPDVAAALEDNIAAGEFFDSLAQFYRNAYLRWIDATKRKPELRAERITEVVRLLSDGVKQRPESG
jgi:Bacteriocin-protection, YdeI or OmpD-Associated